MGFTIRPYRPGDLAAVKGIAADTAYFGGPIDEAFPRRSGRSAEGRTCARRSGRSAEGRTCADRDLVADALLRYYTDFEPESLFVAEAGGRSSAPSQPTLTAGGRVVGYAAGSLDTRRRDRVFRRHILPGLALRFVRRHWRRLRRLRLVMAMRVARRRAAVMRSVIPAYPAHCHVNVAAGHRGAGVGRALLGMFIERARASGVMGIHVSTATEGGRRFFAAAGFEALALVPAHDIAGPPRAGSIMGRRLQPQCQGL